MVNQMDLATLCGMMEDNMKEHIIKAKSKDMGSIVILMVKFMKATGKMDSNMEMVY